MKMWPIPMVLCTCFFLITFSGCLGVGGKDQLEYENVPYENYTFGDNGDLSMQLPTPTLSESGALYSNYLRREWVGAGFIDYFPISEIRIRTEAITEEWYSHNKIIIHLNSGTTGFTFFRIMVVMVKGIPVVTTVLTSIPVTSSFNSATIDRFLMEDNAMFIKLLESVRVKEKGNFYKIKVDYAMLAEKMKEIAFKPGKPSESFKMPYELIEAEPEASGGTHIRPKAAGVTPTICN